jgi:hypothetical protein
LGARIWSAIFRSINFGQIKPTLDTFHTIRKFEHQIFGFGGHNDAPVVNGAILRGLLASLMLLLMLFK